MKVVLKALWDSIVWLLLTIAVGLIQIWLYWIISITVNNITFGIDKYFNEGIFLIFSMTLVASIYFDIHFVEKQTSRIMTNSIVFKLFPWVIVGMVTLSTVLNQVLPPDKINPMGVQLMQFSALVLAMCYSFVYKYLLFIENYTG